MIGACVAWLALALPTAAAQDEGTVDRLVEVVAEEVGPVGDEALLYRAALAGVTAHLDEVTGTPGNTVRTDAQRAAERAWAAGERHGIGIEFSIRPGEGLWITHVFDGGPGEAAGLQVDDLVVGMGGRSLKGLSPEPVLRLLAEQRDAPTVELVVRRGGADPRRLAVDRGRYQMESVRVVPESSPPCVRLSFFGAGAAGQLARALHAAGGAGVILDLRDNEGGLIEEALAAMEPFVPEGEGLLQQVRADGRVEERLASSAATFSGPVVVLANRGTRGAAEAFIAALRAQGRATVVGTRTGGDATLPTFHDLGDGLHLRLVQTTLRGPGGETWGGRGLEADVVVEPSGPPRQDGGGAPSPDPQWDAAIRLMLGEVSASD